jgi:hypothetical protein
MAQSMGGQADTTELANTMDTLCDPGCGEFFLLVAEEDMFIPAL